MKVPVRASEVERLVWYRGTDREVAGRALSDVGGRAKIGFGVLELPPGSDTRPAHYHTLEEEHLYVLEGEATLYLGDATFPLIAGAYVCFPAGQRVAHFLHNTSGALFRYLMIGERIDGDEVVYP